MSAARVSGMPGMPGGVGMRVIQAWGIVELTI